MEDYKKHSLGRRAFLLFFFRHIKSALYLIVIAAGVWYAVRWVPADYSVWGNFTAEIFAIIAGGWLVLVLLEGWLEYRNFTYMFTNEAFVMTSGYMTRQETAALYHQIQNVNIERGPWDRLSGVSKIIIYMTGAEKDSTHNKILLPALGKKKARIVQQELLQRARRHFERE